MLHYRPYPAGLFFPLTPMPCGTGVQQGWYCPHCEVFNSPYEAQCPSCETPKKSDAGMPEV